MAPELEFEEVMQFIENNKLMGAGIGFIDAHLLSSSRLSGAQLWTKDKKLKDAAIKLKVCYKWNFLTKIKSRFS